MLTPEQIRIIDQKAHGCAKANDVPLQQGYLAESRHYGAFEKMERDPEARAVLGLMREYAAMKGGMPTLLDIQAPKV